MHIILWLNSRDNAKFWHNLCTALSSPNPLCSKNASPCVNWMFGMINHSHYMHDSGRPPFPRQMAKLGPNMWQSSSQESLNTWNKWWFHHEFSLFFTSCNSHNFLDEVVVKVLKPIDIVWPRYVRHFTPLWVQKKLFAVASKCLHGRPIGCRLYYSQAKTMLQNLKL